MNSTFTKILRILLGIILLVFGLNKFLFFMPTPALPENAEEFMTSLDAAGYMFPFVAFIEIVVGLLLLFNRWVAFALLLLVPITLNIMLYHLFLDLSGIWAAILVLILNIILIYKHWRLYKPLFQ